MTTIDLVGYAAGVLLTFQFLPQVVKTWRSGHADDISAGMLLLTLSSTILYEVYAYMLDLWPVIIMNGIFGLLVLVELGLKMRFERKTAQSALALVSPEENPEP